MERTQQQLSYTSSRLLCKVIGEEWGLGYIPEMGMAGVGFRGGGGYSSKVVEKNTDACHQPPEQGAI